MDEPKFINACQLRDQGRFTEAYREFIEVAEAASDSLDKAGALLYASNTLEISGQIEAATSKLKEAQVLMEDRRASASGVDEKRAAFELFLDYETATLLWLQGRSPNAALDKFDAAIKKHGLAAAVNKQNLTPKEAHSQDFYESIQMRRSFILADLGRWKEAMPILEGLESPREYKEAVAFYLGHCYVCCGEYSKAKPYLLSALNLGLPPNLKFRAHAELGIVYMALGGYARAKIEFETTLQTADTNYLKDSAISKRLEICCRQLGLQDEAEHYARMK